MRGVYSPWEHGSDATGYSVTAVLIHEVLIAQDLDSSVALHLRNDMGRFDLVNKSKRYKSLLHRTGPIHLRPSSISRNRSFCCWRDNRIQLEQ